MLSPADRGSDFSLGERDFVLKRNLRFFRMIFSCGWINHQIQHQPKLFSLFKDSGNMMDMKKTWLLPGVLIILVLLSAGCTGTRPVENTMVQPTVSLVVVPTTPAPLPITENVTPPTQPPTTVPTGVPVPEPVVTLTTKPIPPPTTSSIYIEGVNYHVFPLS